MLVQQQGLLFIHNISKKWVLLHDNNCAGNIKEIYSFELIFDINFWETVSQSPYPIQYTHWMDGIN